ncbi:MAG: hypothetical protein JXR86_10435 [Spirochaetales bacterium]|nr:hypothetical protein [Spirochaetales bacterium]
MILFIYVGCLMGFLLLGAIRFIKGPELSDRILSLDTMTILVTSLLVILSIILDKAIYLDVAMIFGVVSFVEVIVFGRFLEKEGHSDSH